MRRTTDVEVVRIFAVAGDCACSRSRYIGERKDVAAEEVSDLFERDLKENESSDCFGLSDSVLARLPGYHSGVSWGRRPDNW